MSHPNQKIYHCRVESLRNENSPALSDLNTLLASGFEITDIVPILQQSGGAIFSRRAGIYPVTWVFTLTESVAKKQLRFHSIPQENDYLEKLEQLVADENKQGYRLFRLIPYFFILDPSNGNGIGRGTGGLATFFVVEI
jgi:hypothetical protein